MWGNCHHIGLKCIFCKNGDCPHPCEKRQYIQHSISRNKLSSVLCGGITGLMSVTSAHCPGEGPRAHLKKLAECIRWSYGAGIVLRLGNIARLELNYCIPMGVQTGDR